MVKAPPPIPQEQGLALVERLRTGSPAAATELAEAYLPWLVQELQRIDRRADEHDWYMAASDALMDLTLNPHRYQPDKSDLAAYLLMSARRDLQNAQTKERRHHSQQRRGQPPHLRVVALSQLDQEPEAKAGGLGDPADIAEAQETLRERLAAVPPVPERVGQRLNDVEREVVRMLRAGIRPSAEYAKVMGITHLPPAEQRHEVNKMKDRLKKLIKRGGG